MRLRTCLVLAFALCAPPVFATPIVSIQPSIKTGVTVGNTVSLDIVVSNAVDLYAYEFDLGFNPSVLAANTITEGSFLAPGGATFFVPGTISNGAGTISFTGNSLLTAINGVNGGGTLATVNFTATGSGSSPINLFNVTLLDSSLSGIDTTLQGGSVRVAGGTTAVPEPATLLLIGTGLTVARVRRRR